MNSLVNDKVINSFFNDDSFNTELKAMLNEMIDEELSKEPENMDCDLIDECVQMLIEIEQESDKGFAVFVPLLKSKAIISACEKSGLRHLSRGVRAVIVAAIILLSAMTANAAVDKIFDYNIAHEVVSTISEKLKDWGIIASADNNEITVDKVPTTTPKKEESNPPETTEPSTEPAVEKKTTTNEQTGLQSENVNHIHNNQIDIEEIIDEPVQEETTAQAPSHETADTAAHTYTLTFDADGGECDVSSVEVTYGRPIGELPVPTKEGYEFGGWINVDISYVLFNGRKEETPIKSSTIYNLEKNATVKAVWYERYKIIFNANGGLCDLESLEFSALDIDAITLPTPTKEGYIFLGWYDVNSPVIESNLSLRVMLRNPLILTAHWAEAGQSYTVEFDANGGYCNTKKKDVIIGQPYGELPTPTKSGWKFLGWFSGSHAGLEGIEQITEDSIATYRSKLWAIWYKTTPTVTFDANGGECDVKSKTVYSGNLYGELPTPTREGYIFGAWSYNDQAIYSFSYVDDEATDHTLTAIWIPVDVPVSFNANGGKISINNDTTLTQTYAYMTEYGSLPEVARTGYRFVGWFTEREGGTKIEETDLVDYLDGIALYAHWEKDENICTVTLYSNSNNSSAISYTKGDKFGNPKPNVDGSILYDFEGWYTDKYYGEKVDSDFEITEDIELYARWVFKSSITISLELDKTEYELNEEIDISKINMVFSVGNFEAGTIPGEMLADEFTIIDCDTSTYGEHTLTVTLIHDFGYVVTMTASTTIVVNGCEHGKGTYIVNQVDPTCIEDGYTGDTLCSNCNEVLEKGTIINATGHNENTVTEIINKKEATCTEDGYTGDTVCTVCGEMLQKGKTASKISHVTEDVITKATFSQNGKIERICTMCNQQISSSTIYPASASLSKYSYTYDGKMKTPTVYVSSLHGSDKFNYTFTMDEGRTEVGEYNVYITISGVYYEDEIVLTFSILPE